jgi:Predicted membrane protein (DUF2254)
LTALTGLSAVPSSAVAVPARGSGYVQVVHLEQLLAAAAARRVHVRLRPRIEEHIVAGTPLAWIWPASPEQPAPGPDDFGAVFDAAVRIGFERTLEQDPGLGLRQLVDLACKALSPAINDPYTAIQAIERLSVLFTTLATRPVGPIVAHHRPTAVTVTVPARSFAEHLALGIGLIRRYGAKEPTVIQALLRLLGTVLTGPPTPTAGRRSRPRPTFWSPRPSARWPNPPTWPSSTPKPPPSARTWPRAAPAPQLMPSPARPGILHQCRRPPDPGRAAAVGQRRHSVGVERAPPARNDVSAGQHA